MKNKKTTSLIAMFMMIFISCSKDNPIAETPSTTLTLVEKINKYETLKNYTDFTLGNGIGVDLYMNNITYRNIVNENFDEVTAGYEMKHGAMVGSNGEINFTNVDAFIAKTKEAGLKVFGHTLVWHSNQNATYLNSIIAPTVVPGSIGPNLITNGDFETGVITSWSQYNGATNSYTFVGASNAFSGNGAMKITNAFSEQNSPWKTQIHTDFASPQIAGQIYTLTFMIRSDAAGAFRCSTSGPTAHYQQTQTTSTTWQEIKWVLASDGETGINFDIGIVPGTYYIDNINVSSAGTTTGGIVKTDTEKTKIIREVMNAWISKMVGHYKNSVFAWDVVNEPMKEDGNLRDGSESNAADNFSWIKYLGEDYAVTAFKLARQYGNATDKLFINDYNLEYSLAKCDGLINYVKYIESKGAVVDGIGTQMHISVTSDKSKIAQMFQKLASSGKLIKISELDVRMGTNSPTPSQLATQAEMYRYVVDSFKAYIPKAQQYGVTVWGVSDSAIEHQYWLPNESPNLWDTNFIRKHGYKGIADGLSGKDISLDF